jgi:Fe-S cluster biosynthesis and repair protein YggX
MTAGTRRAVMMEKHFFGGGADVAAGYVPPSTK